MTINATTLVGTAHLAHNRAPGGASTARSIIYLGLRPFQGEVKLFKVRRYTAEVEALPWRLLGESSANLTVGALFVGATDDELLVLGCHEAVQQNCTLFSVDTVARSSRPVLSLPNLDPGPADGYCKSYHEPFNTLYLGCERVHAIDLTSIALKGVVTIDFGAPTSFGGGTFSCGGIVVV